MVNVCGVADAVIGFGLRLVITGGGAVTCKLVETDWPSGFLTTRVQAPTAVPVEIRALILLEAKLVIARLLAAPPA
jgi:hypothetical protein